MTDNPDLGTFKTKDNAALWIQPGGPNTKPYYLGCHTLGDLSAPEGGITLVQCFDGRGGWRTRDSLQAPPEPITVNIGTFLGATLDLLETVRCPAPIYVTLRDCGRPDIFTNFVRMLTLDARAISTRNYTGLVHMNENQSAQFNADIEAAPPLLHGFKLQAVRQAIAETTGLNGIAVCNDERCAGPCGGRLIDGEIAVVVGEALAASPANKGQVWRTEDSGGTWTVSAADPFAGGEDIGSVVCFPVSRSAFRQLVARGETDAGNPAEVSYSDDEGATWNATNVGSVNGQYAFDSGALFALDYAHIWFATTGGYIYFSDDGGETWTAQEDGVITVQNFRAVHFRSEDVGYAVGALNVVVRTLDGGATWESVVGPAVGIALTSVWATEDGRVWVGTAGGALYYSNDRGDTWSKREITGDDVGEIAAIEFANKFVGFAIHNTAAPVGYVHVTQNGGYNWERLALGAGNAGLNDIAVVNERLAYAVGNESTTSVILKISGG